MKNPPQPQTARRPIIAVCGSAATSPTTHKTAKTLGRAIIDAGARLACGGMGGIMEAAAEGAHTSPNYREGDVIGMLPGHDPATANPWIDIAIPTAMGHARNALLTAMADAVIAVEGGAGTLSEIALAWSQGKAVVLLDVGEGWSHELIGRQLDSRRDEALQGTADPKQAVAWAMAGVEAARQRATLPRRWTHRESDDT